MTVRSIADLRRDGYDVKKSSNSNDEENDVISAGETNHSVDFGDMIVLSSFEVINETAGKDLKVYVNGRSTFFTVRGDESRVIDQDLFTSIRLSNETDTDITFRVTMWGFE